jgi:Ca-activated chloride channel homolog
MAMKKILIGIMTVMLLVSCSKGEEKAAEETAATATEKARGEVLEKELPTTMEGIAEHSVGKYGALSSDETKDKTLLEQVGQEVTQLATDQEVSTLTVDEQVKWYTSSLYSLTKREYKLYDNIFDPALSDTPGSEEDKKKKEKKEFNVEILLDASGSMAGKVGGQAKMDAAKQAIESFAGSLPEGAKVSLTVYGHKGSNEEKDKELSCSQIDTVYNRQAYNKEQFQNSLNQFQPTGWTPLAAALEKAMESFDGSNDQQQNVLYVVSDGIETCGGDPVTVAKEIGNSSVQPVVNIIGFDVDDEAQKQLKQVADEAKGKYVSVRNASELESEFKKSSGSVFGLELWGVENIFSVLGKGMDATKEANASRDDWNNASSIERNFMKRILRSMKNKDESFAEMEQKITEEIDKYYSNRADNIIDPAYSKILADIERVKNEKLKEVSEKKSEN